MSESKEWWVSNLRFLLLQKHPDFPKKPLTPYFRFFMEKRAKYAKLHPEMSNLDLTKILSKKYKELPEKKKVGGGKLRCGGGQRCFQVRAADDLGRSLGYLGLRQRDLTLGVDG